MTQIHEQNHYRPVKYTMLEYVQIFGEDLEELLEDNLRAVSKEIPPLESQLDDIATKIKQGLKAALADGKFPLEEWDVYWAFCFDLNWDVMQIKKQLALLYTKRDNLKHAWKVYWEAKKPEAERRLLDVESAKQYPIESMFPGELKKKGNKLWGCCPFHKEDSPSFMIDEQNTFHCFGCGKHGDAIEFLMDVENISFAEAVRKLL